MPLLDAKVRAQVKEQLGTLPQTVTLHVFTQELECPFCREARQLAEELAGLATDRVRVELHDLVLDKAAVETYHIDKIPALAVVGREDHGIRFYGVPGGYEFTSLLKAIRMVGLEDAGLSQTARSKLGALTRPVRLKAYVTLTCPHCPAAVHLTQQLAMVSPWVTAEMIEVGAFPHLANRDQVMAVPKTVIEGVGAFEGALPEIAFVDKVVSLVTGGTT